MGGIVTQEFGDVEADAAGADDRDRARRPAAPPQEHVDIAQDLRVLEARNRGHARHDAGREHDLVERARREVGGRRDSTEPDFDAGELQLAAVVAQRLVELLLARDALRHVELPADFARRLEQRHAVAALGRRRLRRRGPPARRRRRRCASAPRTGR